jgi:hypothetical protein
LRKQLLLTVILFLSNLRLEAQFDFQPYKNVYSKYLKNTLQDSNYYLMWCYNNENKSYTSDTTFYVVGFQRMQLSYLIDYSNLSTEDTLFVLLNDTIVAYYSKNYKKYLVNVYDLYSGSGFYFSDVIRSFKLENENDSITKIDSIKYYATISNEIKYYKLVSKTYDKVSLKFNRSMKPNRSSIKFVLYGQFADHIQQIIYLPSSEDVEESKLKLCYTSLKDISKTRNKAGFCYRITDMGFPITQKEFLFYSKISDIHKNFTVNYRSNF